MGVGEPIIVPDVLRTIALHATEVAGSLGLVVDVRRDYGASGSALQTTGTIAGGSDVLTIAEVGDFQDGQGIAVAGAGAGGALLVTTIASGGGSTTLVLSTTAAVGVDGAVVSHDDTAAIQGGITASAGVSGVLVGVRGDVFVVSSALNIPSQSHIILDGMIRQNVLSEGHLLNLGSSTDVVITGSGTLDGGGASRSGLAGGQGAIIAGNVLTYQGPGAQNVLIQDIRIQNVVNWPWNIVASNNVRLVNVAATNCGNSANFSAGCTDCYAVNCRLDSILNDMGFTMYGNVQRSGFIHCVATSVFDTAFSVFSDQYSPGACSDILVLGCAALQSGSDAFGARSAVGGTLATPDIHYALTYASCVATKCGTRIMTGPGDYDFSTSPCREVVIADCKSHDSSNIRGVILYGGPMTLSNFMVRNVSFGSGNPGGRGISFQADGTVGNGGPFLISNGVVVDTQSTPTLVAGFEADAPPGAIFGPVKIVGGSVSGLASSGQVLSVASGQGWREKITVRDVAGWNPRGWAVTQPAVPGGTGSTNAVTNTTMSPVRVIQTGGAGLHIVDPSGTDTALSATPVEFWMDPGTKAYFATTAPTAWEWYGV